VGIERRPLNAGRGLADQLAALLQALDVDVPEALLQS
jgi:hypothetical protein